MIDMTPEQWRDFNAKIIDEFRANRGTCGGPLEGNPMLLLTMAGAKTGQKRTMPLTYHTDGDSYVVMASAGGAPKHPAWYYNVKAHAHVEVEVGDERFDAVASEALDDERERLYHQVTTESPRFADYQANVEREIPLIVLRRA